MTDEKLVPYPAGSIVRYNGSFDSHDEEYVITGYVPLAETSWTAAEKAQLEKHQVILEDEYPDGVCYEIWQKGVLRKFGNRAYSYSRVRRGSLTPTGEVDSSLSVDERAEGSQESRG